MPIIDAMKITKVLGVLSLVVLIFSVWGCQREDIALQPYVRTLSITRHSDSLTMRGEVVDPGTGIQDRGFCWSEFPDPTVEDRFISLGSTNYDGTYSCSITHLKPGRVYHIRPFIQEAGTYSYGPDSTHYYRQWVDVGPHPFSSGAYLMGSFNIGGKAYLFERNNNQNEVWTFTPESATWELTGTFPSDDEEGILVAFNIGDTGYVAVNYPPFMGSVQAWYSYHPGGGWTKLEYGPYLTGDSYFSFSFSGAAYIGSLRDELSVFWKYEPLEDRWSQLDLPEELHCQIGLTAQTQTKGYFCLPGDLMPFSGNQIKSNCWEFDPGDGQWTPIADYPGRTQGRQVAFSRDSEILMGLGNLEGDLWRYDPENGAWAWEPENWPCLERWTSDRRYSPKGFTCQERTYLIDTKWLSPCETKLWQFFSTTDQ